MAVVNLSNFVPPRVRNDLAARFASLIKDQKVYVAIDAANLYYSALKARMHIDFEQIIDWFQKKAKFAEIGFYTAYNIDDVKQQAFLSQLEGYGYKLIQKPIKVFNDKIKGNMDIEIAVDILQKQADYDIFVLMSGDGDFRYLINAIDKKSIVLSVGGFTSFELHQDADNYFFLNRVSSLWKSKKPKNKPKIDESYLIFVDQMDYPDSKQLVELIDLDGIDEGKSFLTDSKIENKIKQSLPKPKIKLKIQPTKPKIIVD